MIILSKFNSALFLDRDGVINYRPPNDYVKKWAEFEFLPGVLKALKILSVRFQKIILITNQQGIGKNLMTHEDLHIIHQKMLDEIKANGGRIDCIYYCPDLATKPHTCRKPGIKMAEMAKNDFPEINFNNSLMVGDTASDMTFGRNAGMKTILVGSQNEVIKKDLVDYYFRILFDFAKSVSAND